jgi:hypothetical protein
MGGEMKPAIGTVLIVTDHLSESDAIVLEEVPGNGEHRYGEHQYGKYRDGEYAFRVRHMLCDCDCGESVYAATDVEEMGRTWGADVEWLAGPEPE